jgi:putative transposase
MPEYRRFGVSVVHTFLRLLPTNVLLGCVMTLREGIEKIRIKYPFEIDAFILLPEHLHCIWTLPDGDADFSTRWRLIKTFVIKHCEDKLALEYPISKSRQKRQESNLWQRRFWEHLIRDDEDFQAHCNYIHYNPVKHGLCDSPKDWQFSSFHRFVKQGIYPEDWGVNQVPNIPRSIAVEEFE